jgi:hypothetical protein
MMNPVFIALLCVALVWLLILLRRRSLEDPGRAADISHGPELVIRLPKRSLLNQCLSPEDLDFVKLRKSPALLELFLHERRRLAVGWLRQTRREAQRLVRLHVHSVRYAADLRPAAEARLFLSVVLFMLLYAAMLTGVLWYGPLRTRRSFQSMRALAGLLAQLAERIVAGIIPGALPPIGASAGATR